MAKLFACISVTLTGLRSSGAQGSMRALVGADLNPVGGLGTASQMFFAWIQPRNGTAVCAWTLSFPA